MRELQVKRAGNVCLVLYLNVFVSYKYGYKGHQFWRELAFEGKQKSRHRTHVEPSINSINGLQDQIWINKSTCNFHHGWKIYVFFGRYLLYRHGYDFNQIVNPISKNKGNGYKDLCTKKGYIGMNLNSCGENAPQLSSKLKEQIEVSLAKIKQ